MQIINNGSKRVYITKLLCGEYLITSSAEYINHTQYIKYMNKESKNEPEKPN